MICSALIAAVLTAASPASPAAPDSLTLTFDVGAGSGAVMVALYDATTYSGGRPVRVAQVNVAAGERSVTFADLPPAEFAVKAFHDLNGNGRMDTNPFGLPVEPFAFSNNAVGRMGPATWDSAKFTVSGVTAQTISIR